MIHQCTQNIYDISMIYDVHILHAYSIYKQVNSNGDLSFGVPSLSFTPIAFPFPNIPLIAVYLYDVDTRANGSVWYRTTQDPTLLAKAANDIQSLYGTFSPQWLFIATWDHVGYCCTSTPNEVGNMYACIYM